MFLQLQGGFLFSVNTVVPQPHPIPPCTACAGNAPQFKGLAAEADAQKTKSLTGGKCGGAKKFRKKADGVSERQEIRRNH